MIAETVVITAGSLAGLSLYLRDCREARLGRRLADEIGARLDVLERLRVDDARLAAIEKAALRTDAHVTGILQRGGR